METKNNKYILAGLKLVRFLIVALLMLLSSVFLFACAGTDASVFTSANQTNNQINSGINTGNETNSTITENNQTTTENNQTTGSGNIYGENEIASTAAPSGYELTIQTVWGLTNNSADFSIDTPYTLNDGIAHGKNTAGDFFIGVTDNPEDKLWDDFETEHITVWRGNSKFSRDNTSHGDMKDYAWNAASGNHTIAIGKDSDGGSAWDGEDTWTVRMAFNKAMPYWVNYDIVVSLGYLDTNGDYVSIVKKVFPPQQLDDWYLDYVGLHNYAGKNLYAVITKSIAIEVNDGMQYVINYGDTEVNQVTVGKIGVLNCIAGIAGISTEFYDSNENLVSLVSYKLSDESLDSAVYIGGGEPLPPGVQGPVAGVILSTISLRVLHGDSNTVYMYFNTVNTEVAFSFSKLLELGLKSISLSSSYVEAVVDNGLVATIHYCFTTSHMRQALSTLESNGSAQIFGGTIGKLSYTGDGTQTITVEGDCWGSTFSGLKKFVAQNKAKDYKLSHIDEVENSVDFGSSLSYYPAKITGTVDLFKNSGKILLDIEDTGKVIDIENNGELHISKGIVEGEITNKAKATLNIIDGNFHNIDNYGNMSIINGIFNYIKNSGTLEIKGSSIISVLKHLAGSVSFESNVTPEISQINLQADGFNLSEGTIGSLIFSSSVSTDIGQGVEIERVLVRAKNCSINCDAGASIETMEIDSDKSLTVTLTGSSNRGDLTIDSISINNNAQLKIQDNCSNPTLLGNINLSYLATETSKVPIWIEGINLISIDQLNISGVAMQCGTTYYIAYDEDYTLQTIVKDQGDITYNEDSKYITLSSEDTSIIYITTEEELRALIETAGDGEAGDGEAGDGNNEIKTIIIGANISVKESSGSWPGLPFIANITIDGSGNTIYFENASMGLIQTIGSNVVVQNLAIAGNITGASGTAVGGIAGAVDGSATNVKIQNCYFRGNISATNANVGGIVGTVSGGTTITNCISNGVIKGTNSNTAGICYSANNYVTIYNCVNYSVINITRNGNYSIGVAGICASDADYNTRNVYNCFNFGNINIVNTYTGDIILSAVARCMDRLIKDETTGACNFEFGNYNLSTKHNYTNKFNCTITYSNGETTTKYLQANNVYRANNHEGTEVIMSVYSNILTSQNMLKRNKLDIISGGSNYSSLITWYDTDSSTSGSQSGWEVDNVWANWL